MEIGARLHHVCLLSPDPEKCAAFYGRVYNMQVRPHGSAWICEAPHRRLIVEFGPANRLGFAAYGFLTAPDLHHYRRRLETRIPTSAIETPLFAHGAFAVNDPHGNKIAFGISVPSGASIDSADREPLAARLQHVAFRSTEPAELIPFYRDALGFIVSDRVYDSNERIRACFMRTDREHHALAIFHASEAQHDHLSFEADNWIRLRDWADRFTQLGAPIIWGVGRHGPGNDTFFMVRDPDGNLTEISAELEVCEANRPEGRWVHEQHTLNLWGSAIMRA